MRRRWWRATSWSSAPPIGSADRPRAKNGAPGHVRGFDVKDGQAPGGSSTPFRKPGEFGYDTWLNQSPPITPAIPARGHSSAPTSISASSMWGVDMLMGRLLRRQSTWETLSSARAWWRSTSRRASGSGTTRSPITGLWDYDLGVRAGAPTTSTINGRRIRALAQPTKQAFLFVLNRETGAPIWPIEERAVPQSEVPNETHESDAAVSNEARAVRSAGRGRLRIRSTSHPRYALKQSSS